MEPIILVGLIIGIVLFNIFKPIKTQPGSVMANGCEPERYSQDARAEKFLNKCQRWPRMQEIRQYMYTEGADQVTATIEVCRRHQEEVPQYVIDYAVSARLAQPQPQDQTQLVEGITQHVDAYGYNAPDWPKKEQQHGIPMPTTKQK